MGQFKKSAVCFISDLLNSISFKNRIGTGIYTNPIRESFSYSFVDVCLRRIIDCVLEEEEACHSHFVHCKGTSLIRANVIGTTHSFAGLEETNQVILIFHLPNRVSQGNCHSKGQSLRDSNHNYTHSNNEGIDEMMQSIKIDETCVDIACLIGSINDMA